MPASPPPKKHKGLASDEAPAALDSALALIPQTVTHTDPDAAIRSGAATDTHTDTSWTTDH